MTSWYVRACGTYDHIVAAYPDVNAAINLVVRLNSSIMRPYGMYYRIAPVVA